MPASQSVLPIPKGVPATLLALQLICITLLGCSSLKSEIAERAGPGNGQEAADGIELNSYIENAKSAFNAGDLRRAIMILQMAREQFPSASSVRVTMAEFLLEAGQLAAARQELETVLLTEPDNTEALQGLAYLHLTTGQLTVAKVMFQRLVYLDQQRVRGQNPLRKVDAQSPTIAYNSLGIIADYEGAHEFAAEHFLLALQITKHPYLYNNLGYSRYLAGNFGAAEWAYKQALALEPGYAPAVRNLALLIAAKGNPKGARAMLEEEDDRAALDNAISQMATILGESGGDIQDLNQKQPETPTNDSGSVNRGEPGISEHNTKWLQVNVAALRVRESGSLAGRVIGKLAFGTRVEQLTSTAEWAQIQTSLPNGEPGLTGWVYRKYLASITQ